MVEKVIDQKKNIKIQFGRDSGPLDEILHPGITIKSTPPEEQLINTPRFDCTYSTAVANALRGLALI